MINLSWNLARNIRIPDSQLAEHLKLTLQRSLTYCEKTFEIMKENSIEILWHGHVKNEAAHYCSTCEIEVFNILFVKEMNRKLMVHCQDCARKTSHMLEGFIVLNQFSLEELSKVFEAFCTNMSAKRGVKTVEDAKLPITLIITNVVIVNAGPIIILRSSSRSIRFALIR